MPEENGDSLEYDWRHPDVLKFSTKIIKYEGWNFNSGNYLFTTGTK